MRKFSLILVLALAAGITSIFTRIPAQTESASGFNAQQLAAFAALEPIDTHTHIYKDDPAYLAMLQKLRLHILDIVDVSDSGDPERKNLDKEEADVFAVIRDSHGHGAVCTSFDPYRFNDANFVPAAIARLNQSFAKGAIAVKVWKNVGMEVKDAQGYYVLPDNPALEPIYKDIAAHHKTLLMHIADPDTAWNAPDRSQPDFRYYLEHPEWYMYKIPGSPSKDAILRARDHVLEMNPDLSIVGAHLGSMESHLNELAQHLDRYPNFAVDLAGRMPYFIAQPKDAMVAFITKYQDRLLYGTDDTMYPQADVKTSAAHMEASYAKDWQYLATNDQLTYRGRTVEGLGLPKSILEKIYHQNAVHWFPGILKN